MKDEGAFGFPGVWEYWQAPTDDEIESTTLITTSLNSPMAPIRDRMPVIVPPALYDAWLNPSTELPGALAMLKAV